jgi:hypothetical protein
MHACQSSSKLDMYELYFLENLAWNKKNVVLHFLLTLHNEKPAVDSLRYRIDVIYNIFTSCT